MLCPCYGFHNLTTNGQFGLVKILNMELGNENSAEISIFVSYLKFTNLQNSIKSHHNFESHTVCLLSTGPRPHKFETPTVFLFPRFRI